MARGGVEWSGVDGEEREIFIFQFYSFRNRVLFY